MRLKFDREFKPATVDPGDELFASGIFVFNVTKLMAYIESNPDVFSTEEVAIETLGASSSAGLSETTNRITDLSIPIIMAEISPERFSVIDGNHRVEKARRAGAKTLLVYRLSPNQHLRFLTSAFAYEKFVEYWNSKLVPVGTGPTLRVPKPPPGFR